MLVELRSHVGAWIPKERNNFRWHLLAHCKVYTACGQYSQLYSVGGSRYASFNSLSVLRQLVELTIRPHRYESIRCEGAIQMTQALTVAR